MWRKIGEIAVLSVAIALIALYIYYASKFAQEHRDNQRVERVEITLNNGSDRLQFTTPDEVRKQLSEGGLELEGVLVDSVDAVGVERFLLQNSYVKDAEVYVTYFGDAHIEIQQHVPVMRLLCGGYNCYVTAEGVVFGSPKGASCLTQVVTGNYRPLFPLDYEGVVSEYHNSLLQKEAAKIAAIRDELTSANEACKECDKRKSRLRKQRRRKSSENKSEYRQRLVGLEKDIVACTREYDELKAQRTKIQQKLQRAEQAKERLQAQCNDFMNLISFVAKVKGNSHWSSEVTQVEASTTSTGEISLRLVPRSGDFTIEFGTLADSDAKLSKLQKFYDKALSHIGRGYYKMIDARFDKQIICTK